MNNFITTIALVGMLAIGSINAETRTFSIATGQEEGTYFKIGNALKNGNPSIKVLSTKGSIQNFIGVEDGIYDFGIVQSDILFYFREQKKRKLSKVIGAIYREPIYILIRNKLRLSRIAELQGKRVAIGLDGSGTQYTSGTILGIFGITIDELKPFKLTYREIASALQNETIDAAFIVNLKIPKSIDSLIRNNFVYCLKINRSELTKIASFYPNLYLPLSAIDPKDNKNRFLTISVTSLLISNYAIGENIVYNFAKRLCDKSFRFSKFFKNYELYGEPYPFLVNRKVGKPDLFHKSALKYYENKNLFKKYTFNLLVSFLFPFLLFLFPFLLIGYRPTRIIIRRNNWVWISYILLAIICVGYFLLYIYESKVGNPDITGSPADLFKMLSFIFKAGEVFCVTNEGILIRTVMLVASGVFIAIMTAKVAAYFVGKKILEVFKMFPNKNKLTGHIVLCNWTHKIQGVVQQLRSGFSDSRIIIVLTQPNRQTSDKLPITSEYDDVYTIIGNPSDFKYLQRANISGAQAVLILADSENSNEPDAISLMTLLSVMKVLSIERNIQKKPNIVVEVNNPVYANHMYEAGADEVIVYSDITHKLLAQAVITPGAIDFVREILTTTDDSNEIYFLIIPQKYEGLTFQEFAHLVIKKHSTTSNPLTVVGVRSEGRLYINPRIKQFSKIKTGDEAAVLAWVKPKNL